jgi:hypothetical protein
LRHVQLYTVLSADSVTEGHPAQQYFRERFVGLRAMVVAALRDVAPGVPDDRLDLAASTIIGTMDGCRFSGCSPPRPSTCPRRSGLRSLQ